MTRPVNLADATWRDRGMTARFASPSRCWGVTDGAGRALSRDGVTPSTWSTKRVASEIAAAVSDELPAQGLAGAPWTWVDVTLP